MSKPIEACQWWCLALALAFILATPAAAKPIPCLSSAAAVKQKHPGQWARYRLIKDRGILRQCWYKGKERLPKSMLAWKPERQVVQNRDQKDDATKRALQRSNKTPPDPVTVTPGRAHEFSSRGESRGSAGGAPGPSTFAAELASSAPESRRGGPVPDPTASFADRYGEWRAVAVAGLPWTRPATYLGAKPVKVEIIRRQ